MFCTRCGKPLPNGANFCAYCGEPTVNLTARNPEDGERKEEFRFEVDPEFVWDVKDFTPKRERIDDEPIIFNWEKAEEVAHASVAPAVPARSEEKTEVPLADLDTWLNFPEFEAQAALEEEALPEEIQPEEASQDPKATVPWRNSIDKFYTFSKKNEEFQKLLDKEYEKLKNRAEEPSDEPPLIKLTDLEMEEFEKIEEPSLPEAAEMAVSEADLAGMRKFDTRELNRDLFEIALSKTGIAPGQYEIDLNDDDSQFPPPSEKPTFSEKPKEVVSEDQGFVPKFLEEASSEEPDPIALLRTTMPMAFDVNAKIDQALGKSKPEPEPEPEPEAPIPEPIPAKTKRSEEDIALERARILRDLWGTAEVDRIPDKAEEAKVGPVVEKENPAELESAGLKPLEAEAAEPEEAAEPTKEQAAESATDEKEPEAKQDTEKEAEKSKGSPVKKIVIGIIVALLVAELGAIGVTLALPYSPAAKMINENAGFAVEWLKAVMPTKEAPPVDEDEGSQKEEADKEEDAQLPESNFLPITEGPQLVQSQLVRNVNIQSVTWNGALAYDSSKDYGLEDLNKSAAIANNYWYTKEDGTKVAYDQEVAGTLIAFDSGWIDYVNNGDTALMPLLKEGGEAYESTKKFSKIKKMTEVFKSLQIGEIRVGAQGFYIWAKEDFEITEKGKTTAKQYSWVYYMEPVDSQMKIVKYIKLD